MGTLTGEVEASMALMREQPDRDWDLCAGLAHVFRLKR